MMRIIFYQFLFCFLLGTYPANAQFTSVQKSYSSLVNLLTNPGAELGKAGWTIATDTFSVTTTAANVGTGSAAFSWNSAGAARTLTSNAVAIPAGLYGKNGAMSCNIQVPSGSATHTINAYDGTNILSSATITSSTTYARTTINFPFPSSGSIYLRLASVAADEPQIYIDDCILADAMLVNLSQVNQASFVGNAEWTPTGACAWTSTTGGFTNFGADTDCPNPTITGSLTAAGTKIPAVVAAVTPGTYEVIVTGNMISDTSDCHWRVHDGTTGSGGGTTRVDAQSISTVVGNFTYTTGGSKTFQIQGSTIGGGANCAIVLDAGTTAAYFGISVKRFPSTSELAYRPDVGPSMTDIGSVAWTPTGTWSTNTTYVGKWRRDGDIMEGWVTVSTAGAPTATALQINMPSGYVIDTTKLSNTTANHAQIGEATVLDTSTRWMPVGHVGQYTSSVLAVFGPSTTQAGETQAISQAFPMTFAAGDEVQIHFRVPIVGWTSPAVVMPILVGSVTNSSSGATRIEYAQVTPTSAGTCTINSQGGSWLSSTTPNAAGDCTVNLVAGTFSATPKCFITPSDTANAVTIMTSGWIYSTTTSAVRFVANYISSGSSTVGAWTSPVNIQCLGAR